jgi:hypothetical protein
VVISVSADSATRRARERYPTLAAALDRHLSWAREFALAGDIDSAIDALRDAHATGAELRLAPPHATR